MFAGRPTVRPDSAAARPVSLRVGAPPRVALVGSPNSGKSTLFNRLTGHKVKVANYPGVTVEISQGEATIRGRQMSFVDLPGTYSLDPISKDEEIAVQIIDGLADAPPDAIVVVSDATSLARNLPMLGEVLSRGLPTILVLSMIDELKARGGSIRVHELSARLGIPVVPIVGNRGLGIDDLTAELARFEAWPRRDPSERLAPAAYFAWSDHLLADTYSRPTQSPRNTDAIDRVLLHPLSGTIVFLLTMFLLFQCVFTVGSFLQDYVELGFEALSIGFTAILPEGWIQSLVVEGIVAGVGGVLVFLPQIALVLLIVSLLEAVGYMARAAFVIDRVMGWAGLEGRCFVALLSSYACAIPGIMAARTVPCSRSRLSTMLVAPFMTCSARLPVYTLLIGAFIPAQTVFGVFSLQGITMFSLYLLGSASALVAAAIFKRGFLRGKSLPFTMELPPYRRPMPALVWNQCWRGIRSFLKKAGTLILATTVVLWVLMSFPSSPPPADMQAGSPEAGAWQLEHSYAAEVGKTIEPAIAPLGFDWRIGIGLIGSLAAREVINSTLAQIYAVETADEDTAELGDRLAARYSLPTALSLLVFFVYALQCISTLAVLRRETHGWKWPVFAFSYMLVIAYVASFVTYRVSSVLLA